MKSIKSNLILNLILLTISALLLVTTTFAYFSDRREISNTMTSGNVEIVLTEAAVKNVNGNLVEDTEAPRIVGGSDAVLHDYGVIHPGQIIYKDPTILNKGSEDAWIAFKITVTDGRGDLTKIMGYEEYDGIDIHMLLSGSAFDEGLHVGEWNGFQNVSHNERYAMIQKPNKAKGEYEFYFFFNQTLEKGKEITLFENFIVPPEWNNSEMMELIDLKINIQAFATQTFNLNDCFTAMTNAFPDYFELN